MPKQKSKATNTVPVSLEKAEERSRTAVSQVPEEVVASIKNAQQIEDEQAKEEHERLVELRLAQTRNKAIFYVGVFLGVGTLFLIHRYVFSGTKPEEKYVGELVNGAVDVLAQVKK